MSNTVLLYFKVEEQSAQKLARYIGVTALLIARHNFPDGEFKLQLPTGLPSSVVVFHTLDHPNEKLIELFLVARAARQLGVRHLTLIAPYLAYMRQDMAFIPGEVVSQKIIGDLLASLFDAVIAVDPHLHRISKLEEAIPVLQAIALSAAPMLGALAASKRINPFLVGPDSESEQWIAKAALQHRLDCAVANKVRHGDRHVDITLPQANFLGRSMVLLDDIASSGHTLASAAKLLLSAGAKTVDVAVTHALFDSQALDVIRAAGVSEIWSTDCIAHTTNAVSVLPMIAKAFITIPKKL